MPTFVVIGFSIFILYGCGSSFPKPKSFSPSTRRLHQHLEKRNNQINSLSGEVSVEVWQKKERLKVRQLFAVKKPVFLRMDTLSPFEQPLATLVSDGQFISLYDQNQGKFYKDIATKAHFQKLSRLALKPEELVTLLRGQIPRITNQGGKVEWDAKKGMSVLILQRRSDQSSSSATEIQKIYFKEPLLEVRELHLYSDSDLQVRIQLAQYTSKLPTLPQRIRIQMPREDIEVNVNLKEYTLNPDLPEAAFQHVHPPHLHPEPLAL